MPGVSVLVLTRATTARPADLPSTAAHTGIDFTDVAVNMEILRAHHVDCIISAITTSTIHLQIPLADAARAAGVQLFVPSEFGTITRDLTPEDTPSYLQPKMTWQVRPGDLFPCSSKLTVMPLRAEHCKSIGLPTLRIYVREISLRALKTMNSPNLSPDTLRSGSIGSSATTSTAK
ncbi:hypothetical protein BD626DRAFT_50666 [Schizophyllum amplum]|uniref:Uncharacterized protein n=1 Tax=Schizophyllum amplum TaxID=97359 RepID=A0A550CCJ6_9AGAR|nr:hypothetical protein BD626DRAFT_50666 [Auriculariopsis ampla]